MKDMCTKNRTVRGVILLLMLVSMIFILCACTASEEEITGVWKIRACDFADQDTKLEGSDEFYYLNIKGGGAFDIFKFEKKNGKPVRTSLLKQPGTYRFSGGWLVLNEAAASKPYVDGTTLTLKNDNESISMERRYQITYRFTGDVPTTANKKLPKDDNVYCLGDPYEVQKPYEAGFVEDKLAARDKKLYTFHGWNSEDGEITGDVEIVGEWTSEPYEADAP